MSQAFFVLVVTFMLSHGQPASIEAKFETADACEAARVLVVQEAGVLADAVMAQGKKASGVEFPKTSAVCSLRPS